MAKSERAFEKSAKKRSSAHLPALTRTDLRILLSYNRKTGHLLNYEADSGRVTGPGMEVLRNRGTLQRLLDCKLISPGGKLTARGLGVCERLQKLDRDQTSAGDAAINESSPAMAPPLEAGSESQIGTKEASGELPPVDEGGPKDAGKAPVTEELNRTATQEDSKKKSPAKKTGTHHPPVAVPANTHGDKLTHKDLVSLVSPQSYEAEQFKILRNNILFPVTGKAPRSILVTSALQGEGKSFVAANLAVSIALNVNKHVLLIDCDLRKPDVHRLFGLGNVPGLSEFLVEHPDLSSLLQRINVERLSILPGGAVPPNPSELMSSERMTAMLEEVRHRYHDRLIVIDSPPPGLAAETSYLARQVDGILLVVEYGKTSREDVKDLMEVVGSEKILGVVINYLDWHVSKRYGYGKYGKYGAYGNGKK